MDAVNVIVGIFGIAGFVVALKRAGQANGFASSANWKADEANRLSREANDLATQANEYAETQLSLATEQHDVTWDVETPGGPRVTLQNESDTETAMKVRVRVTVDDDEQRTTAESVGPGEIVAVAVPALAAARAKIEAKAERERQRLAALEREVKNDASYYLPPLARIRLPEVPEFHSLAYRVDWVTPGGTPKFETRNWTITLDED